MGSEPSIRQFSSENMKEWMDGWIDGPIQQTIHCPKANKKYLCLQRAKLKSLQNGVKNIKEFKLQILVEKKKSF